MALKEAGDTLNAIKALQSCVEVDANYYDAHLIIANLFSVKRNKFAIEYYSNAINLQPLNIDGLYGLGMFYQNTKQLDKAGEVYEQILKIDSNHVFTIYNKGYIQLVENNNPKNAIRFFIRASQLDPDYSSAIYMRGLCYEKLGDKKLAATDYNATLIIEPSNSLALEGLKRLSKK
jgi:Tfp pilus assembly protein PilF